MAKAENYPENKIGTNVEGDDKILQIAKVRLKQCLDATSKIRAGALEDLLFFNGEQWLESILKDRADDRRPALTMNKIPTFANQVINDMRQNRPALKIRPVDSLTDPDTAEVIDGLVRNIMNNGDAKGAVDTAAFYQVACGFGYFRVLTDYCDDDSFDQEIRLDRIENPFSVYFPIHLIKSLDYSDAPYCFVRSKMSKEEYKLKYPKSRTANFEDNGTGDPNWQEEDSVFLAEYFDVKQTSKTIYQFIDGSISETKPDDKTLILSEREVIEREVKWYLLTDFDVLDSKDWPCKWIPIVPVLGQEININGKKEYLSLVRNAKDPQRMYNYMHTAFAEQLALSPKAPWMAAEGQTEDYKNLYQTSNIKNHAVMIYKPVTHMGTLCPPPSRVQPPQVGEAIFRGIELASEQMKEVTGIYDASLGSRSNETSGRAIIARQKQGATSNFHFVDNLSKAINHVGRILIALIPEIYDAARTIRIIGEDMTDKVVRINQVHPENNGKLYDFSVGKYDIVCDVGPSYETKRMENAENLINALPAIPLLGQACGDLLMQMLDFPLADKVAERLRGAINVTLPGIIPPEDQGAEPTKEEMMNVLQDLQKLQQMNQMGQMENQQLKQMIDGVQAELEDKKDALAVKLQETMIRAKTEMDKAQLELQKEQMKQAPIHARAMVDNAVKLHGIGQEQASENPGSKNKPANQ